MVTAGRQINVRLSPADVELLDTLRRSAGPEVSRAELLRSLLRQQRRAALDAEIAEAYDAAAPEDDALAAASAVTGAEALTAL